MLYAALVAALFAALFDRPGSDDYAGWVPTLAVLALPAAFVVAHDRDRLGWAGAAALGVPASLCLGCITFAMLWPVLQIYPYSDELVLLGMLVLGPLAVILMAFVLVRRLVDLPARTGTRRVVAVVAASGALVLLAASPGWWGFWTLPEHRMTGSVLLFLLGALPLGWSLAPSLALLVTADSPRQPPSVS